MANSFIPFNKLSVYVVSVLRLNVCTFVAFAKIHETCNEYTVQAEREKTCELQTKHTHSQSNIRNTVYAYLKHIKS